MKPVHGNINDLNPVDVNRILERNDFGHLACATHGDIYLVPISYVYEDGYLYSHTRPGKKIDMMRKNPHICIQVEEVEDFFHWSSVIAWGKFEEVSKEDAPTAMRQIIKKMALREGEERRSDLEVEMAALLESAIIFRVKIEKATGRSEGLR
jgi:nitroimidazol reductase NimA-like FMN-containing flavoprotein (pyridoxamine 5'-phosphate oxidase superfamily)